MLLIKSDETVVDSERFMSLMTILKRVYIDKQHMQSMVEKDRAILQGIEYNMLAYMNFYSVEKFQTINGNTVRSYLINCEGVKPDLFFKFDRKKKRNVFSMDASIIKKLVAQNVSPYLMEFYVAYTELRSKVDNTVGVLYGAGKTDLKTREGNSLYYVPFYYNRASTGRIYTKKADLQGIPLRYVSGISCPNDYFILWADFSQIDLRVALELCLTSGSGKLKKYLNELSDRYHAFAKSMKEESGGAFDHDVFMKDRGKYKAGILATIYGGSETTINSDIRDSEFAYNLHTYINNNEKYKEYKQRVVDNIALGEPYTCETYFGYKMPTHPATSNAYTASLNKPIQGTSFDIMQLITLIIYDRIQEHVNDKYKFFPILNRHDENLFMCHKSIIPYMYEFIDCCKIQVDDWAPLEIEWSAGYRYKEPDESLINQIKGSMNGHKLTVVQGAPRKKPYNAIPKLHKLYWSHKEFLGYTFEIIGCYMTHKAVFWVHKGLKDLDKTLNVIREQWGDYLQEIGCSRLLIHNQDTDYRQLDDFEVLVSLDTRKASIEHVDCLCMGLAYKYVEKELGLVPPEEWLLGGNAANRKQFDMTWKLLS